MESTANPTTAQDRAVGAALAIRDLTIEVRTHKGVAYPVQEMNLVVRPGEVVGLVGETGSGKSMTASAAVGLLPRSASVIRGSIELFGDEVSRTPERVRKEYLGRRLGMVLQDPLSALNPVYTVREQLYEPLRKHHGLKGNALRERAVQALEKMRIPNAEARMKDYPYQFSGGMRQRIVGAIALSGGADLLIADEPTTALDVTTQAAYLNHLKKLQDETGIAILFITHDMSIVRAMCDRVAVMYAGRVVEEGPVSEILTSPKHPYTASLLKAIPTTGKTPGSRLYTIQGSPPPLYEQRLPCPFAPRCPNATDQCRTEAPPATTLPTDREFRCWHPM